MRRNVVLILLVGLAATAAALSVMVQKYDNGYVLELGPVSWDPLGAWKDYRTKARRDCGIVASLSESDEDWQKIIEGIKNFVPDTDVTLRQVLRVNEWFLVEAEFTAAEPAVMLLQKSPDGYRDAANWGGSTKPFRGGPVIRSWLYRTERHAPPVLLQCYDPKGEPFTD